MFTLTRSCSLLVIMAVLVMLATDDKKESKKDKLAYNSQDAFMYAVKWCKEGNDCPSGQYKDEQNTDCTHFISHVMNAGGITVKGTDEVKCKKGLCIRVKDLGEWFSNATQKFSNVTKLASWKDAKRGDYCFQTKFIFGKSHIMLLNDAPTIKGAKVYGHEHNRCGEFIEFDTESCSYFRIDDSK